MAAAEIVHLPLPTLPEGWSAEKDLKIISSLSNATQRNVEPVGPHFLAHARRKRHQRTFSEDDRIQAQESVKKIEEDEADEISEPEDPIMLQRDAKDWKGQDHYAVLGLSKHRYRATDEQIKRAHRKKVLRHHPDKKAASGNADENDSFFKCIQKATEILLDPVRRRQFDSVDELANVPPPGKKKGNFFKLWSPVFESEARFSKIQPVPKLGDENSTKEEVEEFYNFWYNFDSWRSFEYEDEDVPDDNENRDHKRHIERKNANARRKKKTEDTARLRRLVDDALAADERIKKFRKAERANKDKRKLEKEAEAKRLAEEKEKARLEEEQRKKEAEEAAKAEKLEGKKAKEAAKNAAKKNKRVLKGSVKDVNYFAEGGDATAAQVDGVLNDIDVLISKISNEELAELAAKLAAAGKDAAAVKSTYGEMVKGLVGAGRLKDGETKFLTA
ncbi:zuotin [Histoplasma capsulatum var. duboisii H88]|uniref:Zuotin n=4 Tax=Ajellomyces capsulatus TaxID=5037 RepID=C0NZ34_AJECG|nr:zuotin [Histoplasma capsulatum G186AR]EER44906.1 zuotin [Histoplasma capsulatum H143]EGC45416.1 zuotin [Histoplasma capsulatum var. duboisii H88]KAG5295886.1 zuotin [Histoplasma capsulatum]EEH03474.1 zuotin [Histoplasma capsulatum G186AR]QSS56060.1 zuotin [Histoplasma capsulatum var. duboisii H88]